MDLASWKAAGSRLTVGDHAIFVIDTKGPGEPLLLLHGYPTSSYDYHRAVPILSSQRRCVVHDHLGFGLTDKPPRHPYSLLDQTDLALAVWRELGIDGGHVVAHDYGTSIATELLARRAEANLDFDLTGLTLCNGSMHIEMARLRPIQQMLRTPVLGLAIAALSSRRTLARNLRRIVADPACLPDEEIDVMWELLTRDGGRRVLPRVTRYIDERRQHWERWIGALRNTDVATHLLWATEDPVAVAAMADVLHDEIADSTLTLLHGLGHFPMLEDPRRWAEAVLARA